MGRPKKNPTLDEQTKAAEDKVYKYAKPYREATEELKRLLDIKNKTNQDLLLEAVASSKRSYNEIMEFIQSDPADDEWHEPGQGF